ncbi:MAG: MFS transporter [Nitrospirales bacterium]|nr:MAG: MFS transporter [Nitrospirales bacterium]
MAESSSGASHSSDVRIPIPRGIWALGLVSLCMDMSSELIHSLLPVFMVSGLGASLLAVGLIEGIAESLGLLTKVFSGVLSDFWAKRKVLVLVGYGVAAATKPMFPLASSMTAVFMARCLDRVGKGIRGAPRDALIADLAPESIRATCYGLRQSLDTVGAFLGPLLAIIFMALLANDIRLVLWVAVIPAVIAVLVLIVGVQEPERSRLDEPPRTVLRLLDLPRFGWAFWWVVCVGGALTLARFSEAFLVLRADYAGLAVTYVPMVMIVMSVTYAASAYPAGLLADWMDRRLLLVVGVLALILADLVLAFGGGIVVVMIGVALWGLHMGLTQGLLSTLLVGTVPSALRGTAFGVFNFVSGILLFFSSLLAGFLWDQFGPSATFLAGTGFATLALVGLLFHWPTATQAVLASSLEQE